MRTAAAPHPDPLRSLTEAIRSVIRGKNDIVDLALVALLAEGHLLLEDVPGVGKTTLALALAAATGLEMRRLQFTSDLLPGDVLGVSVFNQRAGEFEFKPGPVFANILLADEINRATPRTQSALLEAMNEHQVSVDGVTRPLPEPFMVIATQNPFEYFGTFPLPESQLDRFLLKTSMNYPDRGHEREILMGQGGKPRLDAIRPVVGPEDLALLRKRRAAVRAEALVVDYLLDIVAATRHDSRILQGVSPRGSLALLEAARASALMAGRDYVIPDDIKRLAPMALGHRIVVREGAGRTGSEGLIQDLVERVKVPL